MSSSSKIFLFLIIAVPLAYLIYSKQSEIKILLDKILLNKPPRTTVQNDQGVIPAPSTIGNVIFNKCDIIVTDIEGNAQKIGNLTQNCKESINIPKFSVSDSRKYLAFADIIENGSFEIKIYSADQNTINSLAIFRSATLLDMEFVMDDKLLILYGDPSTPNNQHLTSYSINAIYQDLQNHSDKYGNLWPKTFEKKLSINPAEGDYFEIVEMGKKISIFGGTIEKPILRGEFAISDL